MGVFRVASHCRSFFSLPPTGKSGAPDVSPINSNAENPDHPTQFHSSLHEVHPLPIRQEFISQRLNTKELEELDIGLNQHRIPKGMGDHIALGIVKALRVPADLFFRKKYVHRAVVLETVAAVPGMVGAVVRHLQSLRLMRHDGGWIAHLLHEAENERMHLLTWMRISSPTFLERMLVTVVQGGFFTIFFSCYLFFPRICHRMVGYLEEEAIISYNGFLKEIDNGHIDNCPAPDIAITYWNLPSDARLRDVVLAVRADEANHRDVNHELSDRIGQHRENLRAPISEPPMDQSAHQVWQKPGKSD
ncbi:alternative oxidase-domain-containing protein [Piptocephalis cylindrospora]|uniref:Alternative oxidase n=1 Tax=Piptocephalis cylindrospora TaxID=1907219 RepID=A0A4P9Y1P7_9FUNG|nr:alternative oxidase-domain-containing protein [Piptocephalis cylindrospora]|eukprot:RKP11991.1 alternative oxidase-domain-containing protein [Piptocephalis cylindrospora]